MNERLTDACIGVLMGGRSAERDVSLRTGQAVHQALLRRGYRAVAIDMDASFQQKLHEQRVGIVFIALHGPGGEDGTIQGFMETIGMPYTGSDVKASALAMHKETAKVLLACHKIPVPAGMVMRTGQDQPKRLPPAGLKWPVIIKPAAQGSTIGISIVRKASEWRTALDLAHQHDDEALVEAYIPGHEVTVSVLRTGAGVRALPTIEIVVPGGFYDYAAKYQKGRTQYLCPAPLPKAIDRRVTDLAVQAYDVLGCDGAARVDFRVTPRGKPYVLEVNTVPGMTETSLLPMAAAKAGMDYDQLTEEILKSALKRVRAARG